MTESTHLRFVYVIEHEAGYYKIGLSRQPERRFQNLDQKTPMEMTLLTTILSNDAYLLEQALHTEFAEKNHKKEWFELEEADVERLEEVGYISVERIEKFANGEIESLLDEEKSG